MPKSLLMIISLALVMLLGATSSNANLLQNGGFETGTFSNWILSGSIAEPSYNFTYVMPDTPGTEYRSYSGNYYAELGPINNFGYMAKEFQVVSGVAYDITFWLANSGVATDSQPTIEFEVYWNGEQGTKLLDLSNPGNFPYTQYSFSVTAEYTGSSSILFAFQNDAQYFRLDDVSVTAVPEPGILILLGISMVGVTGLRKWWKN